MKTIIVEKLNKKLKKIGAKLVDNKAFLSLRNQSDYNWRALSADGKTLYVGIEPLTIYCRPKTELNFKKIIIKDGKELNKLVDEMKLKIDVTIFLDGRFEPPIKEIIIIS